MSEKQILRQHRDDLILRRVPREVGTERRCLARPLARRRQAYKDPFGVEIGVFKYPLCKLSAALKKHWSGRTIEDVAKALKWQGAYETFYRYSSSFSHVSDYHKHTSLKDDGTIVLRLIPASDDETVRTMETATLFLSAMASEIDKRLMLGRATQLEAKRPRIAARVQEQKARKK